MTRSYIKNTAILFAAMAVTKIVGALFKIPLANILGGTGMGYFSTAYGLYSPVFAVTAAGIPTVLMRITAQNLASGRRENAAAVRRTAFILFTVIGLAGTLIVALFARPFAEHIAYSPQSTLAIRVISPAVLFCCVGSVIRGYYEGMSDVMPSAGASVAEAVTRAVFGLALSYWVVIYARGTFESGNAVFGVNCSSYEQAHEAALPYAAAAAILAVTISELCGLFSLIITDRRRRRTAPRDKDTLPVDSRRVTAARLIREIVPIAASALVMNFVSFVDLLTVTRTISSSAATNPDYFSRMFSSVLPYCGGMEGLANFMYGSYTGIAMSLYMIIPSFAGMTEKTSIPEIAAAWERRDYDMLRHRISMLFRAAATIGFPACFGAAAMAEPILGMLYSSRQAEVSVCTASFMILCLGGVFMITASAMFGVFQAIGKAHIPLILMIISVLVKLALNPVLISIPQLNISGAALSSAVGYLVMAVCGSIALNKCIPGKLSVWRAVLPPAAGGILCASGALTAYSLAKSHGNQIIITLSAIFLGAVIYVISLIISRVFRKNA